MQGLDPDILNDFVTESSELLEQLDQNLVVLEQRPADRDLLNEIFRALHTIKGSSSFLALDPLTAFAHAAEEALNALRKGEAEVTAETMDYLLRAVDVVRGQLASVEDGQMPDAGPADLIEALELIGRGDGDAAETGQPEAAPGVAEQRDPLKLDLADSKLDLLPFMVDDLHESLHDIEGLVHGLAPGDAVEATLNNMAEAAEELGRSASFFEIDVLTAEIK